MLAGYRAKTAGSECPLALPALVARHPLAVVLGDVASAVDKEVRRRRLMMLARRVRTVWRPEEHVPELPQNIRRRKLEPYFTSENRIWPHTKVGHFYIAYGPENLGDNQANVGAPRPLGYLYRLHQRLRVRVTADRSVRTAKPLCPMHLSATDALTYKSKAGQSEKSI
jgi:hypothetical protein